MSDKENEGNSKSVVEIGIGDNKVKIKASEEFISKEIDSILSWTKESINKVGEEQVVGSDSKIADNEAEEKSLEDFKGEEGEENKKQKAKETDENKNDNSDGGKISQIADRLGVDSEKLSEMFFISEDNVHIQDPLEIDPKYAFLGYCLIRKHITDDSYRDNKRTKEVLIDREMLDITRWGGTFLYTLRQEGLIKDDPNSDRRRNKPFKITPKGHREFVQWLENQD